MEKSRTESHGKPADCVWGNAGQVSSGYGDGGTALLDGRPWVVIRVNGMVMVGLLCWGDENSKGDYMAVIRRSNYLLSWSYWFGSRTQGLLVHPYITMREIVREHFLRPLVVLPSVVWIMSWIVGVVVGRLGLWLDLGGLWWTVGLGRILVFGWIWVTLFLMLWQVVLGYLYVRFRTLRY